MHHLCLLLNRALRTGNAVGELNHRIDCRKYIRRNSIDSADIKLSFYVFKVLLSDEIKNNNINDG
jgi:hypothetical protein